ncbi:MAG: DUF4830 domain-containing protein [Ruminococcus sp.]|nr:DUF4830 domain-containing protein [Ruminococcus sp.]
MKKGILIFAAAAIAAALAVSVLTREDSTPEQPEPVRVLSVSDRTDYFALHGWEAEELYCHAVLIPDEFSAAYEEYAEIQDKQGLPLREYAGQAGKLYVYRIRNYSPGGEELRAELLVCAGTIAASLVYSEDIGGLRLPVA